jgi:CheY-like chemotaxis protein
VQSSLTVLVVDDEVIIAMAAEAVLSGQGHVALLATGVEEAIGLAGEAPRLDAAVVDLQLGAGSGAELIGKLRARWPGLPVVISTGYALNAEERATLNPTGGRTVVLKKPWDEAELLQALLQATRAIPPRLSVVKDRDEATA